MFGATIEQPKPKGGLFTGNTEAGTKAGEKETPAGPELSKKPSLFDQKPSTSLFASPAGAGGLF